MASDNPSSDNRAQVRDFLSSRRARITPERAGLTVYGANRRVPGLRREEAALLAGVSVDYYTRLERGNLAGVSESVLDALARALQLDDAERDHLFDLARNAGSPAGPTAGAAARRRARSGAQTVRPSQLIMLDAITAAPAFIRNGRMDILAANALGYALYSDLYRGPQRPANHPRFTFLDPAAREFYPDWSLTANNTVAILRTESGRNPYDRGLSDLVGELTTRSEEFARLWAAHNVRRHYSGVKRFRHAAVGELELLFEAMELAEDPGLTLSIYPAEPGSPSEERLLLLASWGATERIAELARG